MKELAEKNQTELTKILSEKGEELRKIRFDVTGGKAKNVKSIKNLKREVAQIMTALSVKRQGHKK